MFVWSVLASSFIRQLFAAEAVLCFFCIYLCKLEQYFVDADFSNNCNRAQVVGWPPIRSYRKNTMAMNQDCLYVKVSMDGAPYLRKVDLKMYSNYKELSLALEKMFSSFTVGEFLGWLWSLLTDSFSMNCCFKICSVYSTCKSTTHMYHISTWYLLYNDVIFRFLYCSSAV